MLLTSGQELMHRPVFLWPRHSGCLENAGPYIYVFWYRGVALTLTCRSVLNQCTSTTLTDNDWRIHDLGAASGTAHGLYRQAHNYGITLPASFYLHSPMHCAVNVHLLLVTVHRNACTGSSELCHISRCPLMYACRSFVSLLNSETSTLLEFLS